MKHLKDITEWKELKNEVVCADCLDGMKKIPDNSIDTLITDPPYGLSFMGKSWDYNVPKVEIWKECLRVLKPGGTALIFAGSRTQHRMAVNVEDAGFILKDCIMWLYGSGFPKATDISKQLDKTKGAKRKIVKEGYAYGMSKGQKADGYRPEDYISKQLSNEAITEEAKLWNGWKSHGLKPAYEPILVCMKPNDGTYAQNALKHGVSGLNIDGARIQHDEPVKTTKRKQRKAGWNPDNCGLDSTKNTTASAAVEGRFPSNIILDEEAAEMLDEQSGIATPKKARSGKKGGSGFGYFDDQKTKETQGTWHADSGEQGASRFFYIAKAPKEEKNRLYGFSEEKEQKITNQYGMPREDGTIRETPPPRKNFHPTVKPLKLMEYLCILTETPTKGIVLDPFMGSWTTALAAQNMGRDFIGFELEEEYCVIGEKRLAQSVMF